MHAKMTRDRKKCFIASLKRVISKLEEDNQKLRETIERSQADEAGQSAGLDHAGGEKPMPVFSSSMYTVG